MFDKDKAAEEETSNENSSPVCYANSAEIREGFEMMPTFFEGKPMENEPNFPLKKDCES
jgi:hypothetical protein